MFVVVEVGMRVCLKKDYNRDSSELGEVCIGSGNQSLIQLVFLFCCSRLLDDDLLWSRRGEDCGTRALLLVAQHEH
jgi:hypothetical protein